MKKMQRMIDATVYPEDVQNVTVFGENMVKHSLEYDWEEVPRFIGFDVYAHTENGGYYFSTSAAYDFIENLGLETAPIVDKIHVDDFDQNYEVPSASLASGIKTLRLSIIERSQNQIEKEAFK